MAEPERAKPFLLEGVRLVFRNFSGAPARFNSEGDRNFCVCIDDELANEMKADGWNIHWLQPRNEEDSPQAILKVNVKYRDRDGKTVTPPRIVMISGRGKTPLDESMVSLLDWAEIERVDMSIRPYHYNAQGRTGISAYLKSIFVTIVDDPLEMRYMDVPDSAQSAVEWEERLNSPPGG